MDFGNWIGVNDSIDQKKRLASAKGAPCTPLSISHDEKMGIFSGSNGVYWTSLDSCTCVDFARRKLPCKHIYRLAIELGLVDESVKSNIAKVKRPMPQGYCLADAIDALERLSDGACALLLDVLRELFYREKAEIVGVRVNNSLAELIDSQILTVCDVLHLRVGAYRRNELRDTLVSVGITQFNKNMRHELLVQWICDNVPNASEIFAGAAAVRVSDEFAAASRKMYTYLIRRNDDDLAYDANGNIFSVPKGAAIVLDEIGNATKVQFPDDEVTALLDRYGRNRCHDWVL